VDDKRIDSLLQAAANAGAPRASSRLKSRIYSALMLEAAAQGPLRDLEATEACGGKLCVFEKLVEIAPVPPGAKEWNYCRVCHARVLAEAMENPPIFWPGCPYVALKD
jgi:hypothetical protein